MSDWYQDAYARDNGACGDLNDSGSSRTCARPPDWDAGAFIEALVWKQPFCPVRAPFTERSVAYGGPWPEYFSEAA